MNRRYEDCRLWQDAFSNPNDRTARKLADVYETAWDRACGIAKKIGSDAPGLTLHDEHHFLALWSAADLLLPPSVKLTPVETFIFGIAILIHDAAHTTIAFEGGLQTIIKTDEWADNLVSRLEYGPESDNLPNVDELSERSRKAVLFDTVRALHAKQATQILSLPFKHPGFGVDFFIIEDPTIRTHLGDIIGKIAASHHWSLSEMATLPRSLNVISPYDLFGPIRPMFLAALMRTSDAIQIDASRAPDFEFTITKPLGISEDHWKAQNRLAIGSDASDEAALSINSTISFKEKDVAAWWVAYDLANVADRELRDTDALLRDYSQPRLKLRRVKDVADPARFAEHVQTEGWHPVGAEVKVGDTARIIELLGGKGLYGHDDIVPLRELIQNAVDAVRARRLLDSGYKGKIIVELEAGDDGGGNQGYWLRVADDGLGMSLAVLTGPFLTFGLSGWSSSALRKERAGFIGRRFNHVGRYGIGFFSIFMIGKIVKVTTRPFDQGILTAKLLEFLSGLGSRPIIKDAPTRSMGVVTTVEVFINEDAKHRILHRSDEQIVYQEGQPPRTQPAQKFTIVDLLGMICPTIDVEIEGFDSDSNIRGTVAPDWICGDPERWVCRINGITPDVLPAAVKENIDLIEPVGTPGRLSGRAALNPSKHSLGIYSVGGLARKKNGAVRTKTGIVGCLERLPSGPKREVGASVDSDGVSAWATSQVLKWAKANISPQEKNFIAAHASSYGGDVLPIANAKIDGKWYSVEEIFDLLQQERAIYAPIRPNDRVRNDWRIMGMVNLVSGLLFHPDDVEVDRRNVLLAGATEDVSPYWTVADDENNTHAGLISTLGRYCAMRGKELEIDGKRLDFGFYKGETALREMRTKGDRIVLPAIEIKLTD